MREPGGELLHLADSVGEFFFDQHLEVGADHLVAVGLAGLVVGELGRFHVAPDAFVRGSRRQRGAFIIWVAGIFKTWADECVRPYVGAVLLDLAKDPGIRWGGAADHYRVTARLRDHGTGVFRRANVAVADHRNLYRILDGGNPLPSGLAAITLLTRARMQGDCG